MVIIKIKHSRNELNWIKLNELDIIIKVFNGIFYKTIGYNY